MWSCKFILRHVAILVGCFCWTECAVAADQQVVGIDFTDLKFDESKAKEFDASMLSEKIQKLDGKEVRLAGMMSPTLKQDGISKFVLMNAKYKYEMSFGVKYPIYDRILVTVEEPTQYLFEDIEVVGTLKISPLRDEKRRLLAVIELTHARIVKGQPAVK